MRRSYSVSIFCLAITACALTARLRAADANFVVPAPGISFSSLTGPDESPYTGHTEGSFAVTPTAGNWFKGLTYGDPSPSIFDGPVNSPGVAVIQITDGAGPFTLSSLRYSSNNGDSGYDIQAFFGATLVYTESGTLSSSVTPFTFKTLTTTHPAIPVDGLFITVVPGPNTTSINLDNIGVSTVPEPGALLLMAGGLAVLFRRFALAKTA